MFANMKDKEIESQHLIEGGQDTHDGLFHVVKRLRWRVSSLTAVLCVSLTINLALVCLVLLSKPHPDTTIYANLTWSASAGWGNASRYMDHHHKTKTDQAWEAIDFDAGMVAIDDEEARSLGLPRAQRFPWDESKGIYLINGYHNLHCLKWLWRSLAKFRDGKEFEHSDWHGFHCLDSLRQDTICYADDTPRYTGEGQNNATSGFHQNRQCRDWSQLEQWAEERSSCYRFMGNDVEDTLDRHKFCPEGSPYNDLIAEIYGPGERQRLVDLYGQAAM